MLYYILKKQNVILSFKKYEMFLYFLLIRFDFGINFK